uniref:NADH-ubiquinone oxidoreductase chain 5 n=1 Tax=Lepidonotopodium sp. YZ-2018 TaxID=2153333 RepID=A0A343W685_9ANNE|nr:NADH dehydrogenase subunit 5 [Lepidonotopodium sp. YZ-2018]
MHLSPSFASKMLWSLFPFISILSLTLTFFNFHIIASWTILSLNSLILEFSIILDPWGTMFSSVVLFISANVLRFTDSYMTSEKFPQRFTSLILLFVLSMNFLIFIPNMMCLLLGWDGLGIISFLLVIYYQNPKSLAAGMITALMNRIGDVMILMSIVFMLNLGHWSILVLWENNSMIWVSMFILIAGFTKSAQIPFSSWLPAAMAAPTPVSALVHSSTLVTAGVFLLFRFHYALHFIPFYSFSLLIMASITMFMAGTAALTECDMKKIIALSTLSQLGVMMSSLGLNLPTLAFFHLITHALFKALLFLAAGSMINFHHHSQDLRFMGNLIFSAPLTSSSLIIANMALCGSPFLAGFYSKDLILETSLYNPTNLLILFLLFTATMMTSAYSIRFLISIIWNSSNSLPFQYTNDSTLNFTTPLLNLTLGAITSGALINWVLINSIPEPTLPLYLKVFPLAATLLGGVMAYYFSSLLMSLNLNLPLIHFFISHMWFLSTTTSQATIVFPLKFSHNTLKSIDMGWIEMLSSQGLFLVLSKKSSNMLLLSKNSTTTFLTLSFLGFLFMWM